MIKLISNQIIFFKLQHYNYSNIFILLYTTAYTLINYFNNVLYKYLFRRWGFVVLTSLFVCVSIDYILSSLTLNFFDRQHTMLCLYDIMFFYVESYEPHINCIQSFIKLIFTIFAALKCFNVDSQDRVAKICYLWAQKFQILPCRDVLKLNYPLKEDYIYIVSSFNTSLSIGCNARSFSF